MPQTPATAVRAEPPAPSRRGACPTLREPMPTGDGLLARFRPIDSTLTPAALTAVARAAEAYGNGLIEITARGSLQVRGLTAATAAPLARAIRAAVAVEEGVPIETAPLAGLDPAERADPRPLAAALRRAIANAGLAERLSPKVTVIVDGGMILASLAADIRVEAAEGGWRIDAGEALGEAAAIAATLGKLDAIAARGPLARARRPAPAASIPAPIGTLELADGTHALGLALPFGSIEAPALAAFAEAAGNAGAREVRLAPRRGFYVVGPGAGAVTRLRQRADALGFVADPADPRLAIAACAGRDGCASGGIATRALAARLAQAAPSFLDGSIALHVSGCAKGCAHPRPASLVLVGQPDGTCGLVFAGSASAEPAAVFPAGAIPAGFLMLERLYRAREHAQESAAEWLVRLGPEGIAAALRG
ncbi:precorrin-3B synthase [Devosia nitrariae]|uniref:precorrin-3B synthase n=1 Tax=Devosia nitrariae TaxID=2071872 RepID=UPI0035EAB09A